MDAEHRAEALGPAERIINSLTAHIDHMVHNRPGLVVPNGAGIPRWQQATWVKEVDQKIVYTVRITGDSYRPRVFTNRPHIVRIGDPDTGRMKKYGGFYPIKTPELDSRLIEVEF